MEIEPIYYAVFYDLARPRNIDNAMNKRIERNLYLNLVDGMETKTVELKNGEASPSHYKIISVSTFMISNTVDNHLFAVCDCEKISGEILEKPM